ncbi:hypothetical protein GGI64_005498 [Rhizobium leguminosarum]|uniref:Uncharacterized protein n=2 Tax=Rhizobium leguminosarum TaxID=384 RepID=A0ABF7QXR0_RHILW|nr:hypothetical protein [Rhizobium leguminosarum]ACI58941.1 hypothetical protein Rleg2_5768 [Rhizobium leguminosarum bv. trifolii WSM2304]NYJ14406.1 hypothetical protein [Rhizobium leguminosarum]
MAGSILISDKVGIPLNSFGMYYLIERIRNEFHVEDEIFKREIYETLDDQGMPFIVLNRQGKLGFNAFVRAAERAYDKAREEESFLIYGHLWRPLFDLLEADPRYDTSRSGLS